MTIALDFYSAGFLELEERGPPLEEGAYSRAVGLVNNDDQKVAFRAAVDDDGEREGIEIALSRYHAEDKATGKIYHVRMEAWLEWDDVVRIHAFLAHLLAVYRP